MADAATAPVMEHDTLDVSVPAPAGGREVTPMEAPSGATLTPMAMIASALERGSDVEVLERLFALHERVEAANARKAFDAAFAAAKGEVPILEKNRRVQFTSSKGMTDYWHEDLAEVTEKVGPVLARHGLSHRFRAERKDARVIVTCIIAHRDGYSEETTLDGPLDDSGNKNNHQAVASAVTYLQRTTLKAALGLAAAKDDDGRAADGPELISDLEAEGLRSLLERSGADVAVFCQAYGIDAVPSLPKGKLDNATKRLNATIEAKASGAGGRADG